jgi:type IV pilus assembly protein PilQ
MENLGVKMSRQFRMLMFFPLLILGLFFPVISRAQETVKPVLIESLEFREVDIKDILRQLAKQYNLNIVFSESVKGLVTVQLNNVSIDQALDSVITVNGFAYTKKENVYKVTTMEEAEREGKQTKLFRLNNAEAVKLKDTLAKVLTSSGSIEADSRSNSIVVTDSLSVLSKIEGMIPSLDETTPQVLIEAKLIETSLTNTEKLGIDWSTTLQAQGSKRPITFPFNPKGRDVTDSMYPPAGSAAADILASSYAFPYAVKSDFTLGTLDFTGLKAVMDFLKTRANTKLVAAPRIMTVNNQKATINVGQVVPVATYERNANTGNYEVTGWEQINIGINLEVTPQISPDGRIKLKLKPEVSNSAGTIAADTINQRPIISTRKAETEVQIKDGQTIVIGGLVKTTQSRTDKKVPFLGDLPFLGKLFSRHEEGSATEPEEKTDLLIFVTAHIIKDGDGSIVAPENNPISRDRPFKLQPRGKNAQ